LGNKLRLVNGRIWVKRKLIEGDIVIDEDQGIITYLGKDSHHITYEAPYDLKGKIVVPSLIDIHCHLRDFQESHKETFESGANAAAAGGYTHLFDMPNKFPPVNSKIMVEKISDKIKKISSCIITPYILLNSKTERPLIYEYPYIKAYMGYTTGNCLTTQEELKEFLLKSSTFLSIHCEDNETIANNKKRFKDSLENHCEIRGSETELRSLEKVKWLLNDLNLQKHPHIAHVTLEKSIKLISKLNLTFEVTPHHLLLNTDDYKKLGIWGKMNPPLRPKEDQLKLLKLFLEGFIPVIATDHAPHTMVEKEVQQLSGVPGLETSLSTILNTLQPLTPEKINLIVEAFSLNPRKLMNINSTSKLQQGEVADLTIIDPNLKTNVKGELLHTKCKWSPWEGQELQGWPVMTIHNGIITHSII